MPVFQSFFLRLGVAALSFLVRPAGYLAAWEQTGGTAGSQAKYLGTEPGSAQLSVAPVFAPVPNGAGNAQDLALAQFLSDPLAKQTVAAGNWRLSFAARLQNAGLTYVWTGRAALYVIDGTSGARRATIFNLRGIGATARSSNVELTCFEVTIPGLACTLFGGDFLCLELGVEVENTTGAGVAPQAVLFADGTTGIPTDNAPIASARGMLVAPAFLRLSLPEPGEPANPTVSFPGALELVKQAFPPGAPYDWNVTDSPDYEWIAFFADLFKRYGWDFMDLLDRESDLSRLVLRAPDWEGLMSLSASRAAQDQKTIEQRRSAILARWRENGPSTLFLIAAAIGALGDYDDPSQVPLIETSSAELRSFNEWFDVIPGGGVIPTGAAFGAANLMRPCSWMGARSGMRAHWSSCIWPTSTPKACTSG